MTKHIHADLMMQYAQDAMTTDEPWLLWEGSDNDDVWLPMDGTPSWNETVQYRRKPETFKINGFDVPEPMREKLKFLQDYFVPSVYGLALYRQSCWQEKRLDHIWLERGLIHLTSEAAELHAKALLSFTEVQS